MIPDAGDRSKPFEGQTPIQKESSYDAPMGVEHTDRGRDDIPDGAVGYRTPGEKVTKSMGALSSGDDTKLTGSGRQQTDTDDDRGRCVRMNEGNVSDEFEVVCEFKIGGMCVTHRSMGAKYVEHWKEWTKMKNGLYGYVNRRKTKYVCHNSQGLSSPTVTTR